MNWTSVQDAIFDWVLGASGLAADKVVWIGKAPRPVGPFLELRVDVSSPGFDWITVADASVPTAGAEVSITVQGPRVLTLRLRCFGDPVDTISPTSVLEKIRTRGVLPGSRSILDAANIGLSLCSSIQSIDGVINSTILEPRATMTVELHLAQSESETATYIESVTLIPTMDEIPATPVSTLHWPDADEIDDAFGRGTWTSAWLCNEESGDLADEVGTVTLVRTGAPLYRQPGAYTGDFGVSANDGSADFLASSSASYDITTVGQVAFYACVKFPGATSPYDYLFGKYGSGGSYYVVVLESTGYLRLETYDGITTRTCRVDVSHVTGDFVDVLAIIDRDGGAQLLATNLGVSTSVSLTSAVSMTTSGVVRLNPNSSTIYFPIYAFAAIASADVTNVRTHAATVITNIRAFTGR